MRCRLIVGIWAEAQFYSVPVASNLLIEKGIRKRFDHDLGPAFVFLLALHALALDVRIIGQFRDLLFFCFLNIFTGRLTVDRERASYAALISLDNFLDPGAFWRDPLQLEHVVRLVPFFLGKFIGDNLAYKFARLGIIRKIRTLAHTVLRVQDCARQNQSSRQKGEPSLKAARCGYKHKNPRAVSIRRRKAATLLQHTLSPAVGEMEAKKQRRRLWKPPAEQEDGVLSAGYTENRNALFRFSAIPRLSRPIRKKAVPLAVSR